MNQQTRNILFMVSSIAVIIGAAMPLFMLKMPWVPYIYAFGAAGMAVCRLTFRYKGKNFRLKRLYHIETFSSLFLVASSYFMFKEDPDWIMLLTVAAVLQFLIFPIFDLLFPEGIVYHNFPVIDTNAIQTRLSRLWYGRSNLLQRPHTSSMFSPQRTSKVLLAVLAPP